MKGIEIFRHVFLYSCYADDSTFFLRGIPSVKELIKYFNQFYHFSCLKANIEKCEIAGIGSGADLECKKRWWPIFVKSILFILKLLLLFLLLLSLLLMLLLFFALTF